jgi:hypothetical protein
LFNILTLIDAIWKTYACLLYNSSLLCTHTMIAHHT